MTYENPTRPDGTGPGAPDADAPAPPPWLQFAPPTAAPQQPPAAAPAPPAPRGPSARPDSASPARETMPPRPDFESRSAPPPDHPAAVRPSADHPGAADRPGPAPADPRPHGGPVPPEPRPEISSTENPVAPPWPPQAPPVPGPDHFGPDNLGPGHVTGPAPASGMPPHPASPQIVPPDSGRRPSTSAVRGPRSDGPRSRPRLSRAADAARVRATVGRPLARRGGPHPKGPSRTESRLASCGAHAVGRRDQSR